MKFAIFVDGPNLKGALDKMRVKIRDYQALYRYIGEKAGEAWQECVIGTSPYSAQLWRVFWYQVGHMDELRLDDPSLEADLHSSFENSPELTRTFLAVAEKKYPEKDRAELRDIAWDLCFQEGKSWYEQTQRNLEGMKRFNYAVRGTTNFVEIIESGHWKIDVLRKHMSEKGVDTALTVELVTQIPSYDFAILISYDADMIPALNYAKHQGKHVAVVEFTTRSSAKHQIFRSSTRLKNSADVVIPINEEELVIQGIAAKNP